MSWTEITRPHYRRDGQDYTSDLTDEEWGLIAPFMPERAEELWRQLGGTGSVHEQRFDRLDEIDPTGWKVTKGASLFPKEAPAKAV